MFASRRQRAFDRLGEALDRGEGLGVALFGGEPREAAQVDEAERYPDMVELGLARELILHVADHVLLHEVSDVSVVEVLEQGNGGRRRGFDQLVQLLGHLHRAQPVADHRFVDEEVEQPHLGVGDAANRLRIDPGELDQGLDRQTRLGHRAEPLEGADIELGKRALPACRRPEDDHDPLDQLLAQAGPRHRLLDRDHRAPVGEGLLGETEGELAVLAGFPQFLEAVAALPHPGHDPGLGGGGRSPAALLDRDDLLLRPALERRGGHAGPSGGFAQGDALGPGHNDEATGDPGGRKANPRQRTCDSGAAETAPPCALSAPRYSAWIWVTSSPRSPVLIRIASSTGMTKILPSPISPVLA